MSDRRRAAILAAMNGNHVSVRLELRLEEDRLTGRVSATGWEREFSGWLGLMGAIDALLAEEQAEEK